MTSQELKDKLSVEDVIKYVTEYLGSDEPEFDPNDNPIFQTICHNPAHHGKHKLFYYVESKQFHCYTECAENFDIFGLTCRAKGYDPVMEFRKAFNDVLNFFHLGGIQFGFGNDKKEELSDGWNILQKFKDFNAPRKELQPLPKVQVRKMKTLLGSCSLNRDAITFNQYLIKAKPACIDYVVLHELVHFIYPNHSKQFYDFLSIYMPDWKERKKVLDQDVVHGL